MNNSEESQVKASRTSEAQQEETLSRLLSRGLCLGNTEDKNKENEAKER